MSELAQAVDRVEIVGIGGQLRVPRLTVERFHCFGQILSAVQVLTLDFSRILPTLTVFWDSENSAPAGQRLMWSIMSSPYHERVGSGATDRLRRADEGGVSA